MTSSYYRPMPLDFLLLELMPEKGMMGGIHWRGRRARDMVKEISKDLEDGAVLEPTMVSARLRSMSVAGYVEDFPTTGGGGGNRIWARTPKGTDFLGHKAEFLGLEESTTAPESEFDTPPADYEERLRRDNEGGQS